MKHKKMGGALALGIGLSLLTGGIANAAGPGNIDEDHGSITIHKYSGTPVSPALPNDGSEVAESDISNPSLEGVEFTLYKVEGLDVTNPADWPKITDLNTWVVNKGAGGSWSVASGGVIGNTATPLFAGYTITQATTGGGSGITGTNPQKTDDDGLVEWGVGVSSDLPVGVYFVQETGAPGNVAEHTLPFLVTVPTAHTSDNTWIYDVNVYPKNALVDVAKESHAATNLGIGSDVSWTVTAAIPTAQRNFESFMLRDVLDPRLTYVADSTGLTLDVSALVKPGQSTPDYEVTYDAGSNTLLVTLTPAGLTKLNANQGKDLVWTFDTTVIKTGDDGIIPNTADVMVNNPSGDWATESTPSGEVSTNWGIVEILKHGSNKADQVLSDAKFQVFASAADADACSAAVKEAGGTLPTCDGLIYDTDKTIAAVSVTRDTSGGAITAQNIFATGDDGKVVIPSLFVGTDTDTNASGEANYWLVEITPPAGYINADEVYPLAVKAGDADLVVTQNVPNTQEPPSTMPKTGAVVSAALKVGAVLLGIGAIACWFPPVRSQSKPPNPSTEAGALQRATAHGPLLCVIQVGHGKAECAQFDRRPHGDGGVSACLVCTRLPMVELLAARQSSC